MSARVALWCAVLLAAAAPAGARPAVVELYTSEGCSSCPPAEALLGRLARDPGVFALAFHVGYWNGPAWRDPFATEAGTARQRAIAARAGSNEVYTPEMVVDGRGFVGSDEATAKAAVRAAMLATSGRPEVAVSLARDGGSLVVNVGAGAGAGSLLLYGTQDAVRRSIGGGENAGATIVETNIVRSVVAVGRWDGRPLVVRVAAPAGEHFVLVVEGGDGTALGAARV
jgi:hypothetical protein